MGVQLPEVSKLGNQKKDKSQTEIGAPLKIHARENKNAKPHRLWRASSLPWRLCERRQSSLVSRKNTKFYVL